MIKEFKDLTPYDIYCLKLVLKIIGISLLIASVIIGGVLYL
jgi:hypothetical protein